MKKIIILLLLMHPAIHSFSQIDSKVHFNVDALPGNVGGKEELRRVFEQQMVYPKDALKNKQGGKVVINFVIRKDSLPVDVTIVSSGIPELDQEALRVFHFYQWVPAVKLGEDVSCNWSETFEFNPSRYSKWVKARGYEVPVAPADGLADTSMTIVRHPDQIAMYQKGNYALQDFIRTNLEYPHQAQLSNIQGTVMVHFVVEPTGLMTNIGVTRGVGGGCDQEAIRVVSMIRWYPAKVGDKFVRSEMTFPMYFILDNEFKDNSAAEQK